MHMCMYNMYSPRIYWVSFSANNSTATSISLRSILRLTSRWCCDTTDNSTAKYFYIAADKDGQMSPDHVSFGLEKLLPTRVIKSSSFLLSTEARFKKLEKRWGGGRESYGAFSPPLTQLGLCLPLSPCQRSPGAAGRMWTETETTNSQSHLDT